MLKEPAWPGKVRAAFDPKAFLSTVDHGRTLSSVARNAVIFRQSGPADAVFYIQKGRIKIVVTSKQGKEDPVLDRPDLLAPGDVQRLLKITDSGSRSLLEFGH